MSELIRFYNQPYKLIQQTAVLGKCRILRILSTFWCKLLNPLPRRCYHILTNLLSRPAHFTGCSIRSRGNWACVRGPFSKQAWSASTTEQSDAMSWSEWSEWSVPPFVSIVWRLLRARIHRCHPIWPCPLSLGAFSPPKIRKRCLLTFEHRCLQFLPPSVGML